MSSVDDRQNSATTGLQIPGLVSQLSPVEQLPFPEYPSLPSVTPRDPFRDSSPGIAGPLSEPKPIIFPSVTRRLPEYGMSPALTRPLPDVHTGTLPAVRITTATLRQPILIRATGKKSTGTMRPPKKGRRWVVHTAVISLLMLIGLGTLMAVVPVGSEAGHSINVFQSIFSLNQSNGGSTDFIAQQAATATAITHVDGYENYGGGSVISPNGGGPYRFAYGNCTYWANMRYHELSGYWVPWLGNAAAWAYGASISPGWIVSSTPHVPSVIVLQPYVEGASGYGHVAVVEHINADGSVLTTNYNWAGYWNSETEVTFRPGPGVTFVWHP